MSNKIYKLPFVKKLPILLWNKKVNKKNYIYSEMNTLKMVFIKR